MIRSCWTCDHFEPANPGVNNSGRCHHTPPNGIDEKTIVAGGAPENVFPEIYDGTVEKCGDFKPATITVPQSVV